MQNTEVTLFREYEGIPSVKTPYSYADAAKAIVLFVEVRAYLATQGYVRVLRWTQGA